MNTEMSTCQVSGMCQWDKGSPVDPLTVVSVGMSGTLAIGRHSSREIDQLMPPAFKRCYHLFPIRSKLQVHTINLTLDLATARNEGSSQLPICTAFHVRRPRQEIDRHSLFSMHVRCPELPSLLPFSLPRSSHVCYDSKRSL